MSRTVKFDLFLYADNLCLASQNKENKEIQKHLNEDFSNIYDWIGDSKLSIHFGEGKTKPILFASKFKRKIVKKSTQRTF